MNEHLRSKEHDYLDVFQEVTRLISTIHDPQQVMDLVVRRLPALLEVDAATIRLLEPGSRHFVLGAACGVSAEYLSRSTIDSDKVMAELFKGKPIARNDMDLSCDHDSCSLISREGVKGAMSLPIIYKEQVIGLLRLLTRERREFSAAELRFAMSLAEQVGVAISNGRMFKEMENQVRLFAAQRHIAKMVNSTLDLDQILASIVDTLPATLGVKGCTIRLLQPATNRLELVAASGLSRDYLDRGSIRREDSIFQALQGEPVAIYDAENDPRVEYHQAIRNEGIKSILAVPIKNDRDIIGVLRLLSATPRSFSAGDIHLTVTLAEEGGNAIEKARTYRQITLLFNQIEEQERFLQTILDSLSMQLVVVDSDKRIIMANSHFLSCHEAGESEVLGKPYDQVVSWKDPDGEACLVEQVFAEGRPLTKERRPASGERHWYEHSLVPVSNGETGVNFVMEAVRDITERHELEQEKLERTKLQGVVEMAGTAAHELNTPLFAALGTAELLYDDLGSEALRQEVGTIIRNLQAMKSLTRQMTAVTGYEPREYVGNTTIVALTTSKENDSTPIDNTQHEEKQ